MIVFDSSTLILLAKCDLLALLAEKTTLVVPPEVEKEALAKPELYDARMIASLLATGKLRVFKPAHLQRRGKVQEDFGLEAGEAEALLLAEEKRAPIGTDDWPAIKAAKIMGIPFLTAVHVLVELRHKGRISQEAAMSKLELLQKVGRYNVRILEGARERIRAGR